MKFVSEEDSGKVREVFARRSPAPRIQKALQETKLSRYIVGKDQEDHDDQEFFETGELGLFQAAQDSNLSNRVSSKHSKKGKYGLFFDNVSIDGRVAGFVEPSEWSSAKPKRFDIFIRPLEDNSISIFDLDSSNNIFREFSFYKDNIYIMRNEQKSIIAKSVEVYSWFKLSIIYYKDNSHVFKLRNFDKGETLFSAQFDNTNSGDELPTRVGVGNVNAASNSTIMAPDEDELNLLDIKGAVDHLVVNENPWAGKEDQIARIGPGENWRFYNPDTGEIAHIEEERRNFKFDERQQWVSVDSGRDAREQAIINSDWNDAQSLDEGAVVQNDTLKIDTS